MEKELYRNTINTGDNLGAGKSPLRILPVTPEDAEELLAIYAPYVEETAISFEYEVPSVEEFQRRIRTIQEKYPYLKAVRDGKILGYAYTHPFVGRAAYDWGAETTIYVAKEARRTGAGRALYEALEAVSRQMNLLSLYACIGCTQEEDVHLTNNSEQFHAHMGFREVGRFPKCGYKFGTWYDMIWMEKVLGERDETPAPFRRYDEVKDSLPWLRK